MLTSKSLPLRSRAKALAAASGVLSLPPGSLSQEPSWEPSSAESDSSAAQAHAPTNQAPMATRMGVPPTRPEQRRLVGGTPPTWLSSHGLIHPRTGPSDARVAGSHGRCFSAAAREGTLDPPSTGMGVQAWQAATQSPPSGMGVQAWQSGPSSPAEFQKLLDLSRSFQDEAQGRRQGPLLDTVLPIADTRSLFLRLSTAELANALLNLELASNERVVDAATAVLSSRAVARWRSTAAAPLLWAVKRTAHAHFCAGETVEEACGTLERMWALGLRGILDFSVEDALDEETCERNLKGFLRTIGHTKDLPPSSVSYACVKLTALCPLPVLERASTLIRIHHTQHPTQPPPSWLLPSLPVLADSSPPLTPAAAAPPLGPEDVGTWERTYERLRRVCLACEEQGVPLLVDAEYQSVEPAVDHLAYAAAVEFNLSGRPPMVYATVQCYLKDALPRLQRSLAAARRQGVGFGVKLVRGAYLGRENELAVSLGVPSPVFERIEDTHECYDTCAALMIGAAAEAGSATQAAVVLATHNYSSGRKAVLLAGEAGLDRTDARLQFAQLKGMADGLSLTLALSGFNVSKYLPYGKVEEVMPYLLRRAQENRGVLGNTRDDRQRLWRELKRRFAASLGLSS